jgi:hypothetical protein
MSCGSRATQAKPEARIILFRAMILTPLSFADDGPQVRLRRRGRWGSFDASCVVVRQIITGKTVYCALASSQQRKWIERNTGCG